jgi:sulfur oxygenase/reductase
MSDTNSPIYIAINQSKIVNTPQSMATMQRIGPKVCTLTANNPGFLGYQANLQTGALPLVGRYGAAKLYMHDELNPVRLYQYTVWDDVESHQDFHRDNFDRMVELCHACSAMVVEGPWEPIYKVVTADMPIIRTPGQLAAAQQPGEPPRFATPRRTVALTEYSIKPGRAQAFEQGVIATMQAISQSPGYLGSMVLEEIGVSPFGSFMLDPESMMQLHETLGANPPTDPKPLFESSEAASRPTKYLIHSEWETPELAAQGFDLLFVNHDVRTLHTRGVLPHLIRGPYVMLFQPIMEEPSWRGSLG